jgi:hypothetical protein
LLLRSVCVLAGVPIAALPQSAKTVSTWKQTCFASLRIEYFATASDLSEQRIKPMVGFQRVAGSDYATTIGWEKTLIPKHHPMCDVLRKGPLYRQADVVVARPQIHHPLCDELGIVREAATP